MIREISLSKMLRVARDLVVFSFPGIPSEQAKPEHNRRKNRNDNIPEHFGIEHCLVVFDSRGNFYPGLFAHQVDNTDSEEYPQEAGNTFYRIHDC